MAEREPVVDRTRLDRITRGNPALARELIDELVEESRGIVERVRASIAASGAREVHDAAHKLKGMAGELGALRLRAAALGLEVETSPERWPAARAAVERALDELQPQRPR
jgi:HPt (histidine-containing phosphotransfer) domain-containing protein